MMNLSVTKKEKQCTKCSGFGIFKRNYSANKDELVECPACFSIHPEVFGLSYRESESVMTELNYRFYVQKPENFWMFLSLGTILLIGFAMGLSIGVGL